MSCQGHGGFTVLSRYPGQLVVAAYEREAENESGFDRCVAADDSTEAQRVNLADKSRGVAKGYWR